MPHRRLYRLCSLAVALTLAPTGLTARSAASPWTHLTSANFTLAGNEAELFQYLRGAAYRSALFTFDAKVSPDQQMKARSLTQGETEAAQGDLLVQMGRLEEAEARLDAVRQREPELADANTALGVLCVRQKRPSEAVEFFHRASAQDPAGVAGRRARTWLGILEPRGRIGSESTSPPTRGMSPDAGGTRQGVGTEEARAEPPLRPMNEGEKRERGELTEIECRPDGLVLHARSGERVIRVTAKRFEDVEFITYRDDLRGSVPCGPRTPPDPVYVTWRPTSVSDAQGSPPIDGQAVAVEFLPKRAARPAGSTSTRFCSAGSSSVRPRLPDGPAWPARSSGSRGQVNRGRAFR